MDELLAVLLRMGAFGQSAMDLARQLMAQFNGINGIDRAHIGEVYGWGMKQNQKWMISFSV